MKSTTFAFKTFYNILRSIHEWLVDTAKKSKILLTIQMHLSFIWCLWKPPLILRLPTSYFSLSYSLKLCTHNLLSVCVLLLPFSSSVCSIGCSLDSVVRNSLLYYVPCCCMPALYRFWNSDIWPQPPLYKVPGLLSPSTITLV